MRASLAAAAVLLGMVPFSGCTQTTETCGDVATKICQKLEQCRELDRVFVDERQCRDSFNALFEGAGDDDAQCLDTWAAAGDKACQDFLDYFSI